MSTPSAPEGRYASFEAFYPHYIHEHSNRTCRRIHVVGTFLVISAFVAFVATRNAWWLLAMPLVGWAMVSASPYNIPTVLYGVIPWPHLPVLPELPNKAAVEGVLKLVHSYGAWLLMALLLLHVGAALRHHLALRDDTLWRMLPLVPRRSAKPEVPSR